MSVLSWLLDLLYPPKCVLCRKLLTGKGPVCPHCMDKLPEFDGAAPVRALYKRRRGQLFL